MLAKATSPKAGLPVTVLVEQQTPREPGSSVAKQSVAKRGKAKCGKANKQQTEPETKQTHLSDEEGTPGAAHAGHGWENA